MRTKTLIIILSIIVAALTIFNLFGKQQEPAKVVPPFPTESTRKVKPTKSLTEAELVQEEMEGTKESYPLIKFVPYETENFEIRYEAPLFLRVTIKKENVETIKKEVIQWIRSKGIDPVGHRIEWTTK